MQKNQDQAAIQQLQEELIRQTEEEASQKAFGFTDEQIVNLSGLYTGRNIYLYDLKDAKRSIESNPYIKCRAINRLFPHELNIEISEREEYLAISAGGGIYTVTDREGFVLDVGRRDSIDGLIPVYGLASMGFTTGTSILSDRTKLRPFTVLEIIDAIGDRTYAIASIDVSNSASIKIMTTDGRTVLLGDSIDIAQKIEYMYNALRKADAADLPGTVIYINSNGTADIALPTPEPTAEPTEEPVETQDPDATPGPDETEAPEDSSEPTQEPDSQPQP